MKPLTLAEVDLITAKAHSGQLDKIGVPYVEHVRAVSRGLEPFGVGLQMAGLLHDTLEDTALTRLDLINAGVPASIVAIVERVTNEPGVDYHRKLLSIGLDYSATLVKISDNAHNSHPDRAAQLPEAKRVRLAEKYQKARGVLWERVPPEDVRAVVERVNPSLLPELAAFWVGGE